MEKIESEIQSFRKEEALQLPSDLDYLSLSFLSIEERQKLNSVKPSTLGAAGRISGITPSSLLSLLRFAKNLRYN